MDNNLGDLAPALYKFSTAVTDMTEKLYAVDEAVQQATTDFQSVASVNLLDIIMGNK
jgi:hypothetical protein